MDLSFLLNTWWGAMILIVIAGHFTIMCTSLYLHRSLTHQSIVFHPIAAFPMRVWLWFFTGMVAKQWVAVHRKHHAHCETEHDPHSPVIHGWAQILFLGVKYYRRAYQDTETLENYSKGVPEDFIEKYFFAPMKYAGPVALYFITAAFFGWGWGLLVWMGLVLWVPFWAAGVVNGLGHTVGYRNYTVDDASRNLSPVGLLLSGEELHNNHHRFPSRAKFSVKWFEFDMGWFYITILRFLGLAKLRIPIESA
jgi:stearoyl-CoA desaturase (Delta-9 desaturase)